MQTLWESIVTGLDEAKTLLMGVPSTKPGGMPNQAGAWRSYGLVVMLVLIVTWSGFLIAVEGAGIGAIIGAIAAPLALIHPFSPYSALTPYASGVDWSILVVAALTGSVLGALGGFGFVYAGSLTVGLAVVGGGLCAGTIMGIGWIDHIATFEPLMLRWQGYRRASWDEFERIGPLFEGAAVALGVTVSTVPDLLMRDDALPRAGAYMRTIILTRGLLDTLDDEELAGILAHELAHWAAGHPVGQRMVWTCGLPLVLIQQIALWFKDSTNGFVAFGGWVVFWPVNVTVRFLLAPLYAWASQTCEYGADARVRAAGDLYREGLKRALTKLSVIEVPQTTWEAVLTRTHPSADLRIERLASDDEMRRRADVLRQRTEANHQRAQAQDAS